MKNKLIIIFLLLPLIVSAQLPYQNTNLSAHERAVDLCNRLTLEEKASLMLDQSPAIPRLGIKAFQWWSEGLHGVVNQDKVTVFPLPIGMAASFNDGLVYKVFDAVSTEFRAKWNQQVKDNVAPTRWHGLSVWTPNINIYRDPRWGRGQETYGEDPYLTGVMGNAVIRGLQGPESTKYRKTWACAKHFAVHSGPEKSRHTDNITDVSPRDLWETYLPAFKTAVEDANVRQVMCAMQRLDDDPCCGSNRLLQQILRDEWGFKYLVASDCRAVSDFYQRQKVSSDAKHAAAKATLAGTDVECGYDYAYISVPDAVRAGLISEKEVDKHVIRLLEGRFDLGEMDDNSLVSWSSITPDALCSKEHKQLSLDIALQSMTLLQNNGNVLPLSKNIGKVAVIGPNADNESMMWGGVNYKGTPQYTVSILEGIQKLIGKNKVVYFQGCDLVSDKVLTSYYNQCSIDGKTGFRGTFWNNSEMEGKPVTVTYEQSPVQVTTVGGQPFALNLNLTKFSAKYETVFRPNQNSKVLISVDGCSFFEILVNGKSLNKKTTYRTENIRGEFDAEAGKDYNIEIRCAQVKDYGAELKFDIGKEDVIDYEAVIKQLSGCKTVIFAGGISPRLEGEQMTVNYPGFDSGDRTSIELPQVQREFLKALKDAGKKVAFVNCSGGAMALVPETESCDAILQAWYGGQDGGTAVAKVLFGEFNPAGKLPVTFYRSTDQLPEFKDYSMRGRTYRYMNNALFPFGYGLSYTKFKIGNGKLSSSTIVKDSKIILTVPVSNIGKRDGAEVVQVYVKDPTDTTGPLKTLRGFKRVEVKAGKTANVEMVLDAKTFELFDTNSNTMRTKKGLYEVYYGTSSADKDLKKIKVTIE